MGRSLSFLKEVLPMVSNFSTIVSFMCLLVSTLLPIPFFCSSQQPKSWSILSFVLQSLFVPVGAMTVECFRIGNGKIMGQFSLLLKEVLPMLLHGLQKTADIATIVSFTCFVLTQFLSFPFFPDWLHNLYSIPCVQFLLLRIPSWPSQTCILWLECPRRAGRAEELTDEQQRPYMGHLLLALKEVTLMLSDLATIISFTCLVLLNVVFPLLSDWLGHTFFLGLVSRQSFFLISFRLRSIMRVAPW